MLRSILARTVFFLLACLAPASAATVTATLGAQSYTNGAFATEDDFAANHTGGPPPFNGLFQGSDLEANFDQSFTFSGYGSVSGLTWGTLFLGIYDNDSLASGNQVASFTANLIDLTALLNQSFEDFQTDTDQVGYYTIQLPTTVLAQIESGSVVFRLRLQNGLGIFGETDFNGAALDVAVLSAAGETVPEPSSWILLSSGLFLLGLWGSRRSLAGAHFAGEK